MNNNRITIQNNRVVALLLALIMTLSVSPVAVFAAGEGGGAGDGSGGGLGTTSEGFNIATGTTNAVVRSIAINGVEISSDQYEVTDSGINLKSYIPGNSLYFQITNTVAAGQRNKNDYKIYLYRSASSEPLAYLNAVGTNADSTKETKTGLDLSYKANSIIDGGITLTIPADAAEDNYRLVVKSGSKINGSLLLEKDVVFTFTYSKSGEPITYKPEKVELDLHKAVFEGLNQTIKLESSIYPELAENKNVLFSSSDESVVTVDEEGTVTAVGAGSATVTATTEVNSVTDSCEFTVRDNGKNRILTPASETQTLDHGLYGYMIKNPEVMAVSGEKSYFAVPEKVELADIPNFKFSFGNVSNKKASHFIISLYGDAKLTNELMRNEFDSLVAFSLIPDKTLLDEGRTYYVVVDGSSTSGTDAVGQNVIVEFTVEGELPEEPEAYETVKEFPDGNWYHAKGDEIIPGQTVAENEYGWWYCDENGKVDFGFTGLAENQYGWWYIENGAVNFNCTGIKNNEYGWWRIENGQVIFSATGVYENEYGWWYVENGKVNFDYTGIKNNEYGWWRIFNGKVDFSAHGVFQNEYGWWYVSGGCVDFSYDGIASNQYGSWYIKNGQVNFDYTGSILVNKKTYKVINGQIVA